MGTIEESKKQHIIDNLIWDDSIDANDVVVEVQEGKAILEGTVPSYSTKLAAEKDAFMVPGIQIVENNIEIALPAGLNLPGNEEIESNIESKLLSTSQINPANIRIKSQNGIVTMSGTVNTFWELNRAEEIVLTTKGVVGIINNLAVNVTTAVTDLDIERGILAAFKRNAYIDPDSIHVSVQNGIVTLTGKLPDYATRSRAYNIAMYTKGVVDVINDISII